MNRVRAADNVWKLAGGEILLPRVFGFCGGVKRALAMLERAVSELQQTSKRLFLLGEVIHNPWVNRFFQRCGVRILTPTEREHLENFIGPDDCAIVPAFGVPLPIEHRLKKVGCQIVDSSCIDVRRLWAWAEQSARRGFGVLIYGRAKHDETVVTKSRLAEAGGKYLVAGDLEEVRQFCRLITGEDFSALRERFGEQTTNAHDISPFFRLAQVSQTTMLYDETIHVRELIRQAFAKRFGSAGLDERLLFQPSVCRATQDRQLAAVELCQNGLDVVMVVGGLGSSNTRHLHELASSYAPAHLIEDGRAIRSADELEGCDSSGNPAVRRNWLPPRRPVRIGVLAGASSPEIVVGDVLERLASFLG